ncbi:hypothetical protein [Sphaerisporangium siamense]|uniref:Cell division septum initiation protein DivIVA n=1 Tax=Sphaerisporangium siamense TaxID=795645 RepID=A0A7W7G8F9_9ACTN|nr:hypothetical protein [Sphaerisporangium siamense]MBB4700252.1 cell division septum initiation protein DivIVA [Sphaerisporangium siamense]
MTNQHDSFPDMMHEDLGFEVVMRGYSRRQVHDHMVRTRNQIRDLEERLARAIDQAEQGRIELAEARRRLAEAPQDYDELGQRLSAILKLAEEEAKSKRESADADATKTREEATAEAERMLTAAQAEAERRVHEATESAERLLAQAGSDAEETLGTARAEAEETLRSARAESDRTLTAAQHEAERLVNEADAQAEATRESASAEAEATLKSARDEAAETLSSAQRRATSLDDHTGRRVTFLTDTHSEVMRRLNEMGSVLTDLLQRENSAGPLIDEAAVLPPRPVLVDEPAGTAEEREAVRVVLDDADETAGQDDRDDRDAAEKAAGGNGDQDFADPRAGARTGEDARREDDSVAVSDAKAGDGQDHDEEEYVEFRRHDAAGPEDTDGASGVVRGRGANDVHQANDHEGPSQGRVRGFFDTGDVHVAAAGNRAGEDGLTAHRP